MYFYIFDQAAFRAKHQRALDKIGLRITDLGIEGEKVRATLTKEVPLLAKDALDAGEKNLIVVGGDLAANQVIDSIAKSGLDDVVFGYIPINSSQISRVLGLPIAEEACQTISRRKIIKCDLGKVNKNHFLTSLTFSESRNLKDSEETFARVKFFFQKRKDSTHLFYCQYQDGFRLEANSASFFIANILNRAEKKLLVGLKREPLPVNFHHDGLFEVVFKGGKENLGGKDLTSFRTKEIWLETSEKTILHLDDAEELRGQKFSLKILPGIMNVIVGTHREFAL